MKGLLFIKFFNILSDDLNGKTSHIILKVLPTISMLKYIPLVKHTSCTIMLDMPALDLSVVIHPIKIPSDINKIDIINEISIIRTIPLLNFKPNNKATITVNTS